MPKMTPYDLLHRSDVTAIMGATCKETCGREPTPNDYNCEMCSIYEHIGKVGQLPAADAVTFDVLEKWLMEIAMNNDSNFLGRACDEIIFRLDALKTFAKEITQYE